MPRLGRCSQRLQSEPDGLIGGVSVRATVIVTSAFVRQRAVVRGRAHARRCPRSVNRAVTSALPSATAVAPGGLERDLRRARGSASTTRSARAGARPPTSWPAPESPSRRPAPPASAAPTGRGFGSPSSVTVALSVDRRVRGRRRDRRDRDRRRLVRIVVAGIEIAARHDDALGDLLDRQQLAVRLLGLAVGGDRPGHDLLAEIARHADAIDPSLTPRQKVRRLAAIGPPGSTELSGPAGIASSSCQLRLK